MLRKGAVSAAGGRPRVGLRQSAGSGPRLGGLERGFSLIEFIVSAAILLILLSIFIPYLLKVREQNNRSRCADNLRILGGALAEYAARNGGDYPRVIYKPAEAPSGYASFTGADAPSPFTKSSAVSLNDVTASLWLLVRQKLAEPVDFVCPSTGDQPDTLTDGQGRAVGLDRRSNFRGPQCLSYSYASPFGDAPGYRLNDTRRAGFALMADRAPDLTALDGAVPATDAPPLQLAVANSANHGRAGQNVLYAQGDVEFESTPYCGIDHDNIYTAATRSATGKPAGPADEIGHQGVTLSPGSAIDSFLVPTAGDPVGQAVTMLKPAPLATQPAGPTSKPGQRAIPSTQAAPSTRPVVPPPVPHASSTRPSNRPRVPSRPLSPPPPPATSPSRTGRPA